MARFSAAHFSDTTDFLHERGIDVDPQELAFELSDLTHAQQAELWDIVENGDYEAWVEYCIEHDIHYHG